MSRKHELGWKRKQQRDLQRYVDALAVQLGLQIWQIKLKNRIPRGMSAKIETFGTLRKAELHIGTHFFKHDIAERKLTLVHELLHVHMAVFDELLLSLGDGIGKTRYRVWHPGAHFVEEIAVEDIARAVAPHIDMRKLDHLLELQ